MFKADQVREIGRRPQADGLLHHQSRDWVQGGPQRPQLRGARRGYGWQGTAQSGVPVAASLK